jgi:hypothetical protein
MLVQSRLRSLLWRSTLVLASIGFVAWLIWMIVGSNPDGATAPRPDGAAVQSFLAIPESTNAPQNQTDLLALIKGRSLSGRLFVDDAAINKARSESALFTAVDRQIAVQHLPFLTEKQKTDDRTFIQYDLRRLASRTQGDTIDIDLPGAGRAIRAVIDQVQTIDGMLRWSGRILDFENNARFTITHATQDGYAIGNMTTPLGSFSLEAKNGYGWIVNHNTDFFLPPDGDDALHHDDTESKVPAKP